MARRRNPSVVFLTDAQIEARRQRDATRARAQAQARNRARFQTGFGMGDLGAPAPSPFQRTLLPPTTAAGLVVDPRGLTIGTTLPRPRVVAKRKPRPGPVNAADPTTPTPTAGSGARATAGTTPAQATTGATTTRTLDGPTATETAQATAAGRSSRVTKADWEWAQWRLGVGAYEGLGPRAKGRQPSGSKPGTRWRAVGWYQKNAAGPAGTTTPAAGTTPAATSTAPVSAAAAGAGFGLPTAAELAHAQYAPYYQELQYQQTQQNAEAAQRRQAVTGFTAALMQQLTGVAPATQQDYAQAQASTQAMGAASADRLAQAGFPGDQQMQADLAAVGAPQSQADQLAAQSRNVFQGGGAVLNQLAGVIPAELLAGEGARQTGFARTLPAVAGLSGAQSLRQALYDQHQAQNDLLTRRRGIALQEGQAVPGYQMQLYNARVAQQQADTQASAAEANRKFLEYQASDKSAQAWAQIYGVGPSGVPTLGARTAAANAAAKAAAAKAAAARYATTTRLQMASIFGYDPETGTPTLGQRKAEQQALANQRRWDAKGKNGGYTPYQKQKLGDLATKLADDFYHGVPPVTRADGTVAKAGKKPVLYPQAIAILLARKIPLAVAQQALDAFYRPGEGGRPYLDYQQRQALRKAGVQDTANTGHLTAEQEAVLRRAGLL